MIYFHWTAARMRNGILVIAIIVRIAFCLSGVSSDSYDCFFGLFLSVS